MEYLVVDVDNRKINIPESITHLGVKDDNETRTLNFRMPKIYKGLDMSGYTIEINYINAKGKADSALAGNIQVGDEEITFQWCAGGTAYAKDGKVRFLVYTYLENEDLARTNEWHTTWAELKVLEGGNVNEQIAEESPRIIEEMLRRILELENGETGGTKDAIQYIEQELTDEQKAQARVNIGAASEEEVSAKVKQAISEQSHFRFVKVDALPDIGEENVIYLVPSAQEESNIYEEYLFVDGVPELIGSTQIDLSGYAPKATTLAGYGITDGATKAELSQVQEQIGDLSKGMDLSTLTMTVTSVDGGNRLTLSDGTTSKYVDIPSVSITDEQLAEIVNAWIDENGGIQAGATTAQAEQIEKNKTEIESIRESLFDVESGYGSANIFDNDFNKSGYYLDGVYKTSANFKCTPAQVPINKVVDTLYAIVTVSASPLSMQFLDENGAYLNGITLSNQTAMTITVPSGATHFVMYAPNAWEGKVCISYEQLSEYVDYAGYGDSYTPKKTESDKTLTVDGGFADSKVVGEKLAEVEQKANDVSSIITEESSGNLFDGTWVDGWFSTENGVDNPNIKNFVVTPYIPYEMSDDYSNSLNVKTSIVSTRFTYAIYDSEKVFISAGYLTIAEFSLCNLPRSGYVRFMHPNTEELDVYVSQEPFVTYEQLKEKKVDEKTLPAELQNTVHLLDNVNIIEKPNGNIFDNVYDSLGSIIEGIDSFNKYNNNFKRTNKYYPFKKGVLYFRTQNNINPLSVFLYDKDKNYVDFLPFSNVTSKDTFLDYDGYFRLYVPLANETLIYLSNDKPSDEVDYEYHGTMPYIEQKTDYENDVCVCFGDSIMAGDTNRPWTSIPYLLGEKAGMKTYNVGFGGTRMSDRGTATEAQKAFNAYSFCHLVEAIIAQDFSSQEEALSNSEVANMYYFDEHLEVLKTIDFNKVTRVTIAYGTNDYTGMNDISNDEDDLDISTVCGALKYSIKKLQEAFPHLKILVITPIWGYYEIATGRSGDNIDYGKGALPAYVEAIMNTSKELKIPCLDAYYQLGFNFYNCEYYFNGGNDNVHLNEKGRERYAELIYGKQKSIY